MSAPSIAARHPTLRLIAKAARVLARPSLLHYSFTRAPHPRPTTLHSRCRRKTTRRAGADAAPRLDLEGLPSGSSNPRTHCTSLCARIAFKIRVVSSVLAVEMHQVMTSCGLLAPTARQPCVVVPDEPVGRPRGEPVGGRGQHDGRAQPRAVAATGKASTATGEWTFRSCP